MASSCRACSDFPPRPADNGYLRQAYLSAHFFRETFTSCSRAPTLVSDFHCKHSTYPVFVSLIYSDSGHSPTFSAFLPPPEPALKPDSPGGYSAGSSVRSFSPPSTSGDLRSGPHKGSTSRSTFPAPSSTLFLAVFPDHAGPAVHQKYLHHSHFSPSLLGNC